MTASLSRAAHLAVIALVVACSPAARPTPTPIVHAVAGTFHLDQSPDFAEANQTDCAGTGGYDDIKAGLGVVVRDGSGTILDTGRLAVVPPGQKTPTRTCDFTFSLDVPEVAFYAIEVGSRGELTYSLAEMTQMDWQVDFTLGP